jgi:hypothetical protein
MGVIELAEAVAREMPPFRAPGLARSGDAAKKTCVAVFDHRPTTRSP